MFQLDDLNINKNYTSYKARNYYENFVSFQFKTRNTHEVKIFPLESPVNMVNVRLDWDISMETWGGHLPSSQNLPGTLRGIFQTFCRNIPGRFWEYIVLSAG